MSRLKVLRNFINSELIKGFDAGVVEQAAGLEHRVGATQDDHIVVLGELNHIVGDFLVAHHNDDVERRHIARADGLDVAQAGDEHRRVLQRQHIAHQIGGEGVLHLFVEPAFTDADCGIEQFCYFSECHFIVVFYGF